ncbi:MAG: toprim domain-containing protein [Fluviibacter sp.]
MGYYGKRIGGAMSLDSIRSIPVIDVLLASGCKRDPADKNNWTTPVGRLTVTGQKFYCHDSGKGGGGAIDLVMLLTKTEFKGAVSWLSAELGKRPVVEDSRARLKAELETKKLSAIPVRVDRYWPRIRHYLTNTRCLSEQLVDQLYVEGRIYSDRYANAVFLLGGGQGAELRGTGLQKFHGVRGEKLPFILPTAGLQAVAIVESAIDCLSLRTLGFRGEVVSLAGNSVAMSKDLAGEYRDRGYLAFAAFDSDKAGDQMAETLGEAVERLRPPMGSKDWNQALCSKNQVLFP